MTVLAILVVIALLIFLLLMTNLKIRVASDGDITLKAGAGPVMLKLMPKKQKKVKLRRFTHRKYLALVEAEKKGLQEKKAEQEAKKSKQKEKGTKESIANTVSLIAQIIERLGVYAGRLRTKIKSLDVTVGGDDAASAAVTYGVISQSVSYLIEILDCNTKLKIPDPDRLSVKCDYTAKEISINVDISVKLRVIDALRTAVDIMLLKMKNDSKNKISRQNNISRKADKDNGR